MRHCASNPQANVWRPRLMSCKAILTPPVNDSPGRCVPGRLPSSENKYKASASHQRFSIASTLQHRINASASHQRFSIASTLQHRINASASHQRFSIASTLQHRVNASASHQRFSIASTLRHRINASASRQRFSIASTLQHRVNASASRGFRSAHAPAVMCRKQRRIQCARGPHVHTKPAE
jgi:hypothetical protein